ncbi:uncharacterized protein [Zea mays]|uniref:uncharacterized protein n=1 Tax=Zea mays TaxID=4577 RepID=UPI0004DEB3D8|nr:uncharacterized protein LOC103653289 [Zea mays]|eukprot:XP_008678451.1 uncharacterized protein LOC103653289 [Zea mays]
MTGATRARFRWTEVVRATKVRRAAIRKEERQARAQDRVREDSKGFERIFGRRRSPPRILQPESEKSHEIEDLRELFANAGFSAEEWEIYLQTGRKGSPELPSQVRRFSDVGRTMGVKVKPWSGPLPKARVSPAVTLGMVLEAAKHNQSNFVGRPKGRSSIPDPVSSEGTNSNAVSVRRGKGDDAAIPLGSSGACVGPDHLISTSGANTRKQSTDVTAETISLPGLSYSPQAQKSRANSEVCALIGTRSMLSWKERNPGIAAISRRLFTRDSRNPKPSFQPHIPRATFLSFGKSFAAAVMSGGGAGDALREGDKVWKEVGRRRAVSQEDVGRHHAGRVHGGHERGRFTWRGRGSRFGGRFNRGLARESSESSRSGARGREENANKRVADEGQATDANGKKHKAELCCEICEENHVPLDCPVFNGPKPSAILCGIAGGESGFFQIPVFGAKGTTPSKETATAFITVKKGAVSPNLIKSEMTRLIPVRWQWTVQAHSDGFVVPFPSIVELQRMVAMKYVHTAGGEGIMQIQQLDQKIEPVQMLQKAWINVYGVPFEIRSFLPLWAIGSILGATQKVDLRYTKRMGVCRLMVGVTDVAKIPDAADIVVGEGIYEIFFKVDKVWRNEVWEDFKVEENNEGGDKGQHEDPDEVFDGLVDKQPMPGSVLKDTVMEDSSSNGSGNQQSDQKIAESDQFVVEDALNSTVSVGPVDGNAEKIGLIFDCPFSQPEGVMAVNDSLSEDYGAGIFSPGALTEKASVQETRGTGRLTNAHLCCGMVPDGEVVPCLGDRGILVSGANGAGDGDSVPLEGVGNADVFSVPDLESLACGGMPAMVDGLPIDAPVDMHAATKDNEYRAQDMPSNAGADGALLGSLHISTGGSDTVCQMDLGTLNFTSPNPHQQFSFNAHPEISLHHHDRNNCSSLPLNSDLKDMFSYQSYDLDGNSAISDLLTKELLVSLSLTQRAKKKQLNLDEQQCRAKRINSDEDIMSKAQRLAAKRNLETSDFQRYTLVQILETPTEGRNTTANPCCVSVFGGGGHGGLREPRVAV